jgi:hypothetical protein
MKLIKIGLLVALAICLFGCDRRSDPENLPTPEPQAEPREEAAAPDPNYQSPHSDRDEGDERADRSPDEKQ